MAQLGFHGLFGIAAGRPLIGKANSDSRKDLFFGFVLGNLLPDADFFALAAVYLFDSQLGRAMHRSFTHSLVGALLIAIVVFLMTRKDKGGRKSLAAGAGLGALTHILLDIFFWFSGVKLLWPLGVIGVPETLDLWANVDVPGLVTNILGALDYAAAAFFLWYLRSLLQRSESVLPEQRLRMSKTLRGLTLIQIPLFCIFMVLAFVLSSALFDIVHYVIFILFLLPLLLTSTIKLRKVISGSMEENPVKYMKAQ